MSLKKEKTPEQLRQIEERAAAKREKMRARKMAAHVKYAARTLADINRSEQRELARTKDETVRREIELAAQKRREEHEVQMKQRERMIMTSTGSAISYEQRKSLYGYGFISIWFIGVLLVFAGPLLTSIVYSLSTTTIVDANMAEALGRSPGIMTEWNNFGHYAYAFNNDPNYAVNLMTTLGALLPQVSMILIFSLFVAVLLNQKFKGRTVMRAIFFFPVLIATGPVIAVINGSIMAQGAGGTAAQFSTMFSTDMVDEFLEFLGLYNLSMEFTNFIASATSDIFNLLWKSGIQILIFLSALQQIPTSAKEAASMEGATAWEFFWKITFPTISPMILANLIYTIIDTFNDSQNLVMRQVLQQVQDMGEFGRASAFAWIYFGIIAVALALIVAIVSKFVFYQVD